jgi:hypothetical protein
MKYMKISWKYPHNHQNENWFPNLPDKTILHFGDRDITLTKAEINICIEFLKRDFQLEWSSVFVHSLFAENESIGFAIVVDIKNKILYVPPGGITTNKNYGWWWGKLQGLFEQIAAKNGYKLYVCIAASEISWFSQRVVGILRKEWYFFATPGHTHAYGIHQSTYDYDGLPALGISHEDMMHPASMY